MAKSIGIDLGTTNSVSGIKKVHTEIIKNAEDDDITPSCVTIKNKKPGLLKIKNKHNFVVGKHALEWKKQDPENTITAVKRLIGRSIHNPEIQKIIADSRYQYKITNHSRGTENSLAIVLGGKEYTPEEISSKILEKIKKDTEKRLKDSVEYAVITVPAYFNDKQKHATRTAAALAGLKVQRLLPEPTAAAISFGVDTINEDDAKTVLIFDFGGGTFDLSVLTISGGQFIEQGKGGNMWLGGEDIDHRMMDYVLSKTAEEYEIEDIKAFIANQEEPVKNRFWGDLKAAVEKAKIRLSDEEEAYIEILGVLKDNDGDLVDVDVELTRNRFNQLIAPVVNTAVTLTRKLLEDIHFTPDLIDNVLLVGGSSRIPCIINAMEQEFGKEKIRLHDRPMLAIAEGAAILSHRLSEKYECPQCGKSVSQEDISCANCKFDLEKYTIDQGVLDIIHAAAHDYYIYLENNEKYLLVEKHTPLPCETSEVFKLVHHDQQLVHMKFFNIVNEKEESIGDLWLGIDISDDDTKESHHVEVTLKIDENNLVDVTASLKECPDVEITRTLSRGKADEKLFVSLENMITAANQKGYSEYTIMDMTSRCRSIIKDINKVINKKNGEVIEPVFNLAEMKIDKAGKMAEQDYTSKPLIYYTKSVLDTFSSVLNPHEIKRIERGIEKLHEMDEHGTYEENVAAYEKLDKALDDLQGLNLLMTIQKAGECCEDHEPARAAKFYNALDRIMDCMRRNKPEDMSDIISSVMPDAEGVLDKYDSKTGIIYKDIAI